MFINVDGGVDIILRNVTSSRELCTFASSLSIPHLTALIFDHPSTFDYSCYVDKIDGMEPFEIITVSYTVHTNGLNSNTIHISGFEPPSMQP